ncbi:MAG: PEPxxWA-CTERM sorting domain-containing protein [Pseudomonadota bacterium]|nr:PEPxxWA-CTERM sorting domain-containing protein [Pseudomonadota bacterium]
MNTARTLSQMGITPRILLGAMALYAVQHSSAQAMTPSGTGIYLNNVVVGTYGYTGNGSASYASGPGISISNGGGTISSGNSRYGIDSAPLPLGATQGALSSAGSSDAGHAEAAVASASADLAGGLVRVRAGGTARGLAEAALADKLTFHVSGGGTSDVTVKAHLDGSFSLLDPSYASANQEYRLDFAGASFYELGGATDVNGNSSYQGHNGPSNNLPPQGWLSYSFSNETPTGFDFTGVVQVTDGQRSSVNLDLNTDCSHAFCAFDHTGTIGVSLSGGATMTSDSGVFLTSTALPVAAVPEPQTWAMMLGGICVVTGLARRRGRH